MHDEFPVRGVLVPSRLVLVHKHCSLAVRIGVLLGGLERSLAFRNLRFV